MQISAKHDMANQHKVQPERAPPWIFSLFERSQVVYLTDDSKLTLQLLTAAGGATHIQRHQPVILPLIRTTSKQLGLVRRPKLLLER